MDTEFNHQRNEEFYGLLHLAHLRAFLIQDFGKFFLPELRTVEQVSLGIGFEFGNIDGDLMHLPDIISLLLLQVLIKGHALGN